MVKIPALGLIGFIACLLPHVAFAEKLKTHAAKVAGEYIVVPEYDPDGPGATASEALDIAESLVRAHGGSVVRRWATGFVGLHVRMTKPGARAVSADPRIANVEENGI